MNKEDYYSYSRIRTFDHCNRYYYYHYEMGLPTESNYAAEFSKHMIHAPIAAFYKEDEEMDFHKQWAALEALNLPKPANKIYSLAKAIKMCHQYWDQYGRMDSENHSIYSVEEKFYDDDHEFQSIPDLIIGIEPWPDGEKPVMLVLDHKVSAYDAKPFPSFHRQLISQALIAVREIAGSFNVLIGINHFNLYAEEITRTIMPLDLRQVEEYRQEYEYKKQQIADCQTAHVWPKNAPDACVRYYGKQKKICEFWNRCEGMPAVPAA